jgi:hypothetical protein
MVATKYFYKYNVIEKDENNKEIYNKKYKSIDDLLADIGYKYGIFSRSTIYRIQKKFFVDKYQNIEILKIKEQIPHRIEKKIVFLDEELKNDN